MESVLIRYGLACLSRPRVVSTLHSVRKIGLGRAATVHYCNTSQVTLRTWYLLRKDGKLESSPSVNLYHTSAPASYSKHQTTTSPRLLQSSCHCEFIPRQHSLYLLSPRKSRNVPSSCSKKTSRSGHARRPARLSVGSIRPQCRLDRDPLSRTVSTDSICASSQSVGPGDR